VLERTGRARLLEFGEVGGDDGITDAEVPGSALQRVLAQLLAKRVHGLGQVASGPFVVGLGPEQGHEFFAAHALPARCHEGSQQRQALGLHGDRLFPGSQAPGRLESAQGLETQHVRAIGGASPA
jgi:hypothetical protein